MMSNDEKSFSKWQWFLIIFMTLLTTLIFIYFILGKAGIDLFKPIKDHAKNIPVLSSMMNDSANKESNEIESEMKRLEKEKENLTKTVQEQEEMIQALQKDVEIKEKEVQELTQEIRSLQSQLEETEMDQNTEIDLASLYSEMSAKKAAEAIALLPESDAVNILSSLKKDKLAEILEKLEPEDRAKFTRLLAKEN